MALVNYSPWEDAAQYGQGLGQALSQGLLALPQRRYENMLDARRLGLQQQNTEALQNFRMQGLEAKEQQNQIMDMIRQLQAQNLGNYQQGRNQIGQEQIGINQQNATNRQGLDQSMEQRPTNLGQNGVYMPPIQQGVSQGSVTNMPQNTLQLPQLLANLARYQALNAGLGSSTNSAVAGQTNNIQPILQFLQQAAQQRMGGQQPTNQLGQAQSQLPDFGQQAPTNQPQRVLNFNPVTGRLE